LLQLQLLHVKLLSRVAPVPYLYLKPMTRKLDGPRNSAWRIFLTAHVTLIELIERDLALSGLPPLGWYDVLYTLEEASDHRLRMNELARAVLLSRSNVTRLVDRLEAEGLLRREPCPRDRRGAFAVITQEGLAMRLKMWTVFGPGIAQYFGSHLSDDEVELLTKVFKRMLTAASDEQKKMLSMPENLKR
jgi:DNA-binding MarR family transcriptional regulator